MWLLGLVLIPVFATSLFGQRGDRAIITGVVNDPVGAAVPDATVTIINEGTGVRTVVSTTSTGDYATPPLVLGTYTVRVEKEGFKAYVRPGIQLVGGATYRQDAALELGAVTTVVEVTAASQMVSTATAEVSHDLGTRYYQDLPVVMGADIRLAEALLHAQPGYVPMTPNGDAMFRGSQFHSRINGGQTMATENWMDGAAFGYAFGHQQTQESAVPYESVQEMKVVNSSFSAQYGHTSGAFIEYVSKSGTNDLHGGVYEYLGNNALNARRFFEYNSVDPNTGRELPGTAIRPSKNNDYGFLVGGPIKKDKTHFFTNLTWFKLRQIVSSGYVWTMPVADFRTGDFSRALDTGTVLGNDALGRPVYKGEIFNPATTRLVGGVPVRDGYGFDPVTGLPTAQANIIPDDDQLRSQIAANWLALLPPVDRDTLAANTFGGYGDPNKIMDIWTWLFRIDHSLTPNLRMHSSYWMNERPTIRKCGSIGGCEVPTDPRIDSSKNDRYISDGFVQRIANRNMHQQFDWVIKPTMFNHTTISYDRWYMGGWSISSGVGWKAKLDPSGNLMGMPAFTDAGGPPNITWNGGVVGYSGGMGTIGTAWARGFQAVNRWQFADDFTLVTGRHTIKAGAEWRWHEFPQPGWARAIAGNFTFNAIGTGTWDSAGNALSLTGDPVASMILGQVNNASFPNQIDTVFSERYWAPWVNDEFKVTDKLTVMAGLRFDHQSPRTERHDRYSTFDPAAMNPVGVPGAITFMGPAGTGKRTWEEPKNDAWGPRVSFAYRLTDKDVIRGGYGIYYGGVMFDMWITYPSVGYETFPTAPNTTNGRYPAFYWDAGWPQNLITYPPDIRADIANGTSPLAVSKEGLNLPRYQNWSLTWQRQLTPNMLVDVSYVANHGTRLIIARSAAGYPMRNDNNPSVLQYGALLLGSPITDPAVQALAAVQAMPYVDGSGNHFPYEGFDGTLAQALRPFPQYYTINWRNLNTGGSVYHSLQAKVDKRFSNGLQFRIAYVWSKLIVDGLAESGNSSDAGCGSSNNTCSGRQNPIDIAAERSVATDDVPHTLILAYTYEFPFGRGKKYGANMPSALDKIVGGWAIAGMHRYDAGRPLSITMANNVGGLLFNDGKRPNALGGGAWQGGKFDPNKDFYLDGTRWADPDIRDPVTGAVLEYRFGNAPRTDDHVRYFPLYNEDINLIKDTFIRGEKYKVRFEAQFGNIFNRVFFCNPSTNWSAYDPDPTKNGFGKVGAQCNIPRRIQFGLRFDF